MAYLRKRLLLAVSKKLGRVGFTLIDPILASDNV